MKLFTDIFVPLDGSRVAGGGLSLDWRVEPNDAPETILATAARAPAPLIAMATHGRSCVQRWVLGTVAENVARQGGALALILRPS